MPFTPSPLGPACPLQAVLGRHFSLPVFAFAQVAMDLEPLVRLLLRDGVLHGPSHTYLGAALIGVFSLLVGRPVCQWLVRSWPTSPETPFLNWLRGPATISWPAAAVGAFVGTF